MHYFFNLVLFGKQYYFSPKDLSSMYWLYKNKQMSGHTNFKTNTHDQAEIDTLKMLLNIPYISI